MGAAVPVISILSTVLGTAFSAYGAMQQGKAAAAQAEYQAAVGRNNAILATRAADDARLRGEEAARRRAVETRQLSGRQRAVLAANGVLVDQGSALDLTSDTAEIGKLDELTIRSNAEREALGYEAQGMNFNASAQLNDMRADNARSSAMGSAFGTVLTGATSVASKWYQYRKEGWDPFGSGGGGGNFSVGLG